MPITKRDRIYLAALYQKNAQVMRTIKDEKEERRQYYSGLNKPMSVAERKRRERIRKKARSMIMDLVWIEASGILGEKVDLTKELNDLTFMAIMHMSIGDDDGSMSFNKIFPALPPINPKNNKK